jgi:hypothetical protein
MNAVYRNQVDGTKRRLAASWLVRHEQGEERTANIRLGFNGERVLPGALTEDDPRVTQEGVRLI